MVDEDAEIGRILAGESFFNSMGDDVDGVTDADDSRLAAADAPDAFTRLSLAATAAAAAAVEEEEEEEEGWVSLETTLSSWSSTLGSSVSCCRPWTCPGIRCTPAS